MSTAAQKATHTRRLNRLADILARFRPAKGKRFDMDTWGSHDGSHHPEDEPNFCGTAACALGHAAMDPQFRAAGLTLEWTPLRRAEWSGYGYGYRETEEVEEWYATIRLRGSDKRDDEAGAVFFGLSEAEAFDLFLSTERTQRLVVARLRHYAKNREELA